MLLAYDQNISNTDGFALMQNSTSLKTLIFRISVMVPLTQTNFATMNA